MIKITRAKVSDKMFNKLVTSLGRKVSIYMLTHIPGRSRETEFSANVGALISGTTS